MKTASGLVFVIILGGCASRELKWMNVSNQKIMVTSTSTKFTPRKEGDEFVYSFMTPPGNNWGYHYYKNDQNDFKLGEANLGNLANEGKGISLSWSWLDAQNKQQLIDRKDSVAPWYTGATAKPGRIAYAPNESDKVNWNRSGYPQTLWEEDLWVGQKKRYYCGRSIVRRGHETAYLAQQGIPSIVNYSYGYGCYFRYTDGRDGLFNATTGWNLTSQELAANPNIVEERIAAFDKTLEPVWDTLEFNPMAYQFDLPK